MTLMMTMANIAECHKCGRIYFHVHERGKQQKCEHCPDSILECGNESCRQPLVEKNKE